MTLHELKDKYGNVAKDMRSLHDKIGDNAWSDEQRDNWKRMKHDLDGLNSQIEREEELRAADDRFVRDNEESLRQQAGGGDAGGQPPPDEQRAAAFDAFLRQGQGDMSTEQRQALRELRAQGTTPDDKGGYTVPTQMLNRVYEAMKDYGGLASVAQVLTTETGQSIEWPQYPDHRRRHLPACPGAEPQHLRGRNRAF